MSTPSFELNKVLSQEAKEIIAAREKAFTLHHTNDIDAAGDEAEKRVRDIFRRKLPIEYYVGHGHIVDENLKYNGQHDLIIADNSGSPILFTSENGTQYFPYESVYAIGEIKSTYSASRTYVHNYVSKAERLYSELTREIAGPTQMTKDVELASEFFAPMTQNPYRNPLVKFMFFVDSGDFKVSEIKDLLYQTDPRFVPNFICFLDKGIVALRESDHDRGIPRGSFEMYPEFIPQDKTTEYNWTFNEFNEGDGDAMASRLAFCYFMLNQHLRECIVLRPNLMKYVRGLIQKPAGTIF